MVECGFLQFFTFSKISICISSFPSIDEWEVGREEGGCLNRFDKFDITECQSFLFGQFVMNIFEMTFGIS